MLRALVTAVACLASTAVLAQDGDTAPLPYLQTSPEDGFIARTLRQERVGHKEFAAAFDDGAAGCATSAKPVFPSDLHFYRHGVTFGFDGFGGPRSTSTTPTPGRPGFATLSSGPPNGGGSVETLIAPGGTGYVGLASTADCAIQIDFRKFARRDGRWVEAQPVEAGDIRDWDEREKRARWPAPDGAAGMMTFLFDAAAQDGCPERSGFAVLRPHSLLSEIGLTGQIERGAGTRFSNDFTIGSGNCRYAMSIRQYARDAAGVLQPVPVSPAIAASRGPLEP